MDILYSLFYFAVAVSVLVAFHEFGHFWVARKAGVKVLRFSVGFGKVVWSYRKTPDSTEYALSAIPLGGYVKMVDEREGEVKPEDLPLAFNRQSLLARAAIVAAGPIFNLLLAVFLFWTVLILGETGIRPIIGAIEPGTLAADAGLQEGDEILKINGRKVPTWSEAISTLFSEAMSGSQAIQLAVKSQDDFERVKVISISGHDIEKPETLYERLGLTPWSPKLKPIIGKVLEQGAAKQAGLQVGDLIVSADGQPINEWMEWVKYVQERPQTLIKLIVERGGIRLPLNVIPEAVEQDGKTIGKIGAGVEIPKDLLDSIRVTYSLSPLQAFPVALERTWQFSVGTLMMIGKMLIGQASVENLSGPISIAQYAGQSAEMGLVPFLKYLGLISVSLGILNLLPIPVLDGGHLLFFAVEAVKGSPVSENMQLLFQQVGVLLLISLMTLAMFLDLEKLFQ
ncbi:RIP metalloprotease RseP [Methylomarinum vadi]|uniref:RIP metalloprotease RseP n=1 Tax=Methylomarinum vadi TaxID=438855 RepID=UPI0004DF4A16|nr:RIP metalloprotease RseP [Methylomarinum vadi]